ncbi:MAG TPA: 3-deoxy-manno-octulosonate cytidylyltransferase [Williamwhitmania sp.]|nr:3-deoxy-manno-octulosonate cytidylyltransferase [Williamwhitmania sp.]
MNPIGIIPARYASTRFPGKPLAIIGGKPMIQRVYEQAMKVLETVVVATDDDRIFSAVEAFGGKVVMTSVNHKSGTDRCAEAVTVLMEKDKRSFDVVLNIQGDEPFLHPEQLRKVLSCFFEKDAQIATLVKPFSPSEDIFNPNSPKVVINHNREAIYFSRSPIPFVRGAEKEDWPMQHIFLKHIGLYGYRTEILQEITRLEQTPLELAESLEQLRWIENGYKIMVEQTHLESFGIDTPEDLDRAIKLGLLG